VIVGRAEALNGTLTIDPGYSYGGAVGGGLSAPFSFNDGTCDVHVHSPDGPYTPDVAAGAVGTLPFPLGGTRAGVGCPSLVELDLERSHRGAAGRTA
jgi:hypothetical protein